MRSTLSHFHNHRESNVKYATSPFTHFFFFMQPLLLLFILAWTALAQPTGLDLTKDEISHLANDPEVSHKVTFTVTKTSKSTEEEVGKLVFAMFGSVVPKTVDNFIGLATLAKGYGYQNTLFHRIIKDFVVQGGDFQRADGTGGYSIYGKTLFDDENFLIKHDKKGRLSMANAGRNTNGAQFFILTGDSAVSLDGRHVVFGQLILGFDVLEKMNVADTDIKDRPKDDLKFSLSELTDASGNQDAQETTKEGEMKTESSGSADVSNDDKPDQVPESTKISELASLSSPLHIIGLISVVSFVGYYALRWSRRRHGITITGFRS